MREEAERQRRDALLAHLHEYDDDIHRLLDECESDDPATSLRAIAVLGAWLEEAEEAASLGAHVAGWTWTQIGDALSRSEQTVWKRYSGKAASSAGSTGGSTDGGAAAHA
jgi:DNA-directed RNA polymerase specialized sigma24 family protein